jgi:hypothetical protein
MRRERAIFGDFVRWGGPVWGIRVLVIGRLELAHGPPSAWGFSRSLCGCWSLGLGPFEVSWRSAKARHTFH